MTASVELTGGCSGHLAEWDDRCYCDSPDVHVEFVCPKAVPGEYKRTPIGKRIVEWVKNKNACKQKPLKAGELSDQYSLARWLTEHYVPSVDAKIF